MDKSNDDRQEKVEEKKKLITVLGIYLTDMEYGKAVLLVRNSFNNEYCLPGGRVILQGGPKTQRKREIHNLSKFIFQQTGFNTSVAKPINSRNCAFYSVGGQPFKVYRLVLNQKMASPHWDENILQKRLVNIERILHDQYIPHLNRRTKMILKDFFKKRRCKKRDFRDSHLNMVRDLQAIA